MLQAYFFFGIVTEWNSAVCVVMLKNYYTRNMVELQSSFDYRFRTNLSDSLPHCGTIMTLCRFWPNNRLYLKSGKFKLNALIGENYFARHEIVMTVFGLMTANSRLPVYKLFQFARSGISDSSSNSVQIVTQH
jgi:hypothetical protein